VTRAVLPQSRAVISGWRANPRSRLRAHDVPPSPLVYPWLLLVAVLSLFLLSSSRLTHRRDRGQQQRLLSFTPAGSGSGDAAEPYRGTCAGIIRLPVPRELALFEAPAHPQGTGLLHETHAAAPSWPARVGVLVRIRCVSLRIPAHAYLASLLYLPPALPFPLPLSGPARASAERANHAQDAAGRSAAPKIGVCCKVPARGAYPWCSGAPGSPAFIPTSNRNSTASRVNS